MIPLQELATFTLAALLIGLAPGPDNLFVLTQSALYGAKAGLQVILGLCTGLLVHLLMVFMGVAVLVQTSVVALTVLKIIGALYLLSLAWQTLRAVQPKSNDLKQNKVSAYQLYRRGIIMNVTNPKVLLFFLAFLPQFLQPETGSLAMQISLLGTLFILATLFVFSAIALFAGKVGQLIRKSSSLVVLNRMAALVYTVLAVKLLTAELAA